MTPYIATASQNTTDTRFFDHILGTLIELLNKVTPVIYIPMTAPKIDNPIVKAIPI